MFFAEITALKPETEFYGLVCIKPTVKKVESNISFVHRRMGSLMLGKASKDRVKFNDVIINTVQNVVEKLPRTKRIRIISDGAGGHRFCSDERKCLNEGSLMLEN